jgi:hypothetical protein
MRKLANIARRVFGNSVQTSYFERFHWSILNFWPLQTAEHAVENGVICIEVFVEWMNFDKINVEGIIISLCFLINRRLLQKFKSN